MTYSLPSLETLTEASLSETNAALLGLPLQERLRWAFQQLPSEKIVVSSSFGAGSAGLLHAIAQVAPGQPILFLETGYHFAETQMFAQELMQRLGLALQPVSAFAEDKAKLLQDHGEAPYIAQPDTCCHVNKVLPMQRALKGKTLWISGVRGQQTDNRAAMQLLQPAAAQPGLWRFHPLIDWSREQLEAYLQTHALPKHPLTSQGYRSIGCAPCTQIPAGLSDAGDERAGRWQGSEKTECGLHYL